MIHSPLKTDLPSPLIDPAKAAQLIPPTDDGEQAAKQTILVGIDWADKLHAFHAIGPDGSQWAGNFKQSPQAILAWLVDLQAHFPDSSAVDICLETSRGAIINALLQYPNITIRPVNPQALANYRKAFHHGGGKSDPVDAQLILQYLQHYRTKLLPLRQDQPLTRELATLCEDRRRLVHQRVKLSNELISLLKIYFLVILELKPANIYANFVVKLLKRYPTLELIQAAGPTKLRKLLCGIGSKEKLEQRIKLLVEAIPLSTDEVLLRTSARRVKVICTLLETLNQSVKEYDAEIKRLVRTHADYQIFASLPGTADNTQARMIAALGDDRSRFTSANALQCAAGIAPVTTQSGKSRYVSSRWACSKFMKQTFHEFAGLSLVKCRWAKAYYDGLLRKGKSPQMARRSLAYKWIRIIYRCWQTHEAYDDARYTARLVASGSPLANQLT